MSEIPENKDIHIELHKVNRGAKAVSNGVAGTVFAERSFKMTLQEYKDQKMQNPEFAKAYEEIQHEMRAVRADLEAGTFQNMPYKDLSQKTGMDPSQISR